jgi:small ligand-binding sensory domain FIST
MGLFAPSTLTINERPLTMMWGKNLVFDGAVGLAMLNQGDKLDVRFNGVRPITDTLQVTASTGNIVESLNNSNPTRILLQALEKSTSVKASSMASYASIHPLLHESVFLGTVDPSSGKPMRMYKITAGDPSRGPLSLEVGRAPSPGESIQVCRRLTPAMKPINVTVVLCS